jgi:hypothetical protein
MLRIKAGELVNSGTDPGIVAEALRLWATKTGIGPGLLPSLVSDVIKTRAAANGARDHRPPTAFERKTAHNLAVIQGLADQPTRKELRQ